MALAWVKSWFHYFAYIEPRKSSSPSSIQGVSRNEGKRKELIGEGSSGSPAKRKKQVPDARFMPRENKFVDDTTHHTGDEPIKLPFQALREITNDFSEELKIGSGSFGSLYKGLLDGGGVIAVKVFDFMSEVNDEEFGNVFEQLRSVKHENLVQLVGFCNEEEEELVRYDGRMIRAVRIHRALCFQFVPNGSLAKFLSEQYLGVNWQVCFKIIKGICEGLKYLHEASIMHFDLKPENILLDEKMVPKITDFGLLCLLGEDNTKQMVNPQATCVYVPPEFRIQRHMSKEYDIYSLGALIKNIVIGAMGYLSMDEIHNEECIEFVHNTWRKKLQEIPRYPSIEADCKQVRTCITIAINCMNKDEHKRPLMKDIVCELCEVEYKENYPRPREEQASHDVKVRKMSFEEFESITNKFSEKLGRDGFGAVYKGKLTDGEVVAVKRLDENSRKPEQQFERVVNLMRIEHKNIVRLKGYCYETRKELVPGGKNPKRYTWQDVTENLLCCEFLPNGSMDSIISDKSCKLAWGGRHKIIRGICEGLHYLHEGCQDAPIVHKGLKPSNILLDDDMIPKLGDFGLSRSFPKEQTDATSTIAVRSRGYIAPEFMNTGKATVRSNIYSLGVMIIEIATGDKCPSDGSSCQSFIENVRKTTHKSYVSSKYPSLETGFIDQVVCWINIALKCVEIQPERRPTIGQIMCFIETESANPEYYDRGEFNLPSRNNIVAWSPALGDHANELDALKSILTDASANAAKLSYALLKSVTRNFSRMIGHGGFGAVYLGIIPDGKVAVKKLSILQDLSNNAFVGEITCLKKAQHNNVVRLLGYCAVAHGELVEVNGRHVIAEETQRLLCFEYVPNGNLQDYIKEKCRGHEWKIRYQMIRGICHGLQHLHKQRISHLDLKPENVLLDDKMEPKITDFGLSRFLPEGQSIVKTKQIFGTLGCIAPELIDSGEISFKTDIYGLGIIVTKLLMKNISYDIINWHRSLEVSCSQEKRCVEIAKRCVQSSQDKRPTIDEIIDELNEIDNMIQEVSPVIQ